LLDEKRKHRREIIANSPWRGWAVRPPPFGDAIDLPCRSARNE
jgi:hypothetical protein